MKKMSYWGVGPKIMFPGYTILFILSWTPEKISIIRTIHIPGWCATVVSLVLMAVGIALLAAANSCIKEALKRDRLIRTGLFSYVRNPMYAAHLFFIMPGICLLTDNAFTLFSTLCTVIIFYVFIFKEEKALEDNFGIEYKRYKSRVGRLMPRFFFRKRNGQG